MPKQLSYPLLALALSASTASLAETGFAAAGPAVTTGGVSNGQSTLSLGSNPAAVGFDRRRAGEDTAVLGAIYVGGALEYGDVEELFDQYDALADSLSDTDGSSTGINFDAIDPNNPDFNALIAQIEAEATRVGALLALVSREGYANADAGFSADFVINSDIWGGTLGFDFGYSGSASAQSILDPLEFDADTAETQLLAAYDLAPGDPTTTYDLTGGLTVTINPNTGNVSGSFTNDSLLAIRAAQQTHLGMSYSYPVQLDNSTLYLGGKAKYVRMGLSRITPRIGDITDSEQLFDDIRDADFENTSQLSLDVGALWVAEHVSVGLSAEDLFEPEYKFNDVDTSGYSDEAAAIIERLRTYQQDSKVTLESSLYTADRTWAVSALYEVNETTDPLGEVHQWLQVSAGWQGDNFWLPNVRLGYRTNQAGSKVNMYSLGFTLFRYVDLDFATATEKVSIEGDSLPRGASVSLGFTLAI